MISRSLVWALLAAAAHGWTQEEQDAAIKWVTEEKGPATLQSHRLQVFNIMESARGHARSARAAEPGRWPPHVQMPGAEV